MVIEFRSYFTRQTPFILLWVAANFSYVKALSHMSVSAAISIFSSNVCIIWLFSWMALKQPFSAIKLGASIMIVIGVVIISFDKEFAGNILGVFLILISAFSAAAYKVLFKFLNGNATLGQVSLFMSGLGVFNLFLNIIPTVVLNLFHIEHIEWEFVPWLSLIIIAFFSLAFNFFVNFGIALLNPLVVSIGMIVGLPLSYMIDILFRNMLLTIMFGIGTSLILISFVLTVLPIDEWWAIRGKQKETENLRVPTKPSNYEATTLTKI